MSKKNKGEKPEKKVVPNAQDSLVTESFAGDAIESIEDLVGEREISPNDHLALLRLDARRLNSEIIKELKLARPSGMGAIVAGPYQLKDLESWSEAGLIRADDLMQVPFNRWLPASEYFSVFPKNEMTSTIEMSSFTLSGTDTVEMTQTMEMTTPGEETTKEDSSSSIESARALELEGDEPSTKSHKAKPSLPSMNTAKSQTQTIVISSANALTPGVVKGPGGTPLKSLSTIIFGAIFLLVIFFSVKGIVRPKSSGSANPGPLPPATMVKTASQIDLGADWPEWMQPLGSEVLIPFDDALVAKMAAVVASVRYGNYALDENQIQLLKKMSSPATASWAARKLASNILSVWMAMQGVDNLDQAIRTLKPIYEASPEDYVTVSNLAILSLENEDLAGADELAQVALRLCSRATCWFSNLLMANVKLRLSQFQNAEKHFQDAADDFAEPVAVFGAWAQFMARDESGKSGAKVRALVERAIWGDPDRFLTSPLPDAMGSTLLYQRLAAKMNEFFSAPTLALSPAQQDFLKWRFSLISGKSSVSSAAPILAALSAESSTLSQLLSVYLLSLKGDLDQSRERLTSILVLFKDHQPTQSWPWTLAGDLQTERGFLDQSMIFYQSALNRSSRDRAAVYGLGQLMRKKSDFQGARQKFGEASAMDVQYVLPKLRVSRFEWYRRLRDK